MMNPQVKQRWYNALLSGKYKQIKDKLTDNGNGRCCLGVLCEVAAEDGVVVPVADTESAGYKDYNGNFSWWALPPAVQDWAGLSDHDPFVEGQRLSGWNDKDCSTFEEIAEKIQENL